MLAGLHYVSANDQTSSNRLYLLHFPAGTAPKILEPLTDRTIEASKETTLKCKISSGEPAAEIHWYKDNKELYHGKKYQLSYTKDVATVQFRDTGVSDGGTYRCEAVNKLGRVDTEAKITVQC